MVDQIDRAVALDQISSVADDMSTTKKRPSKSAKNSDVSQTGSTEAEHKASKKPKSKCRFISIFMSLGFSFNCRCRWIWLDTALKQQRLPAWQPILTAKTVFPLFFGIGIVFVVLGGVLLHFSNIVNEYVIDYTDCDSITGNGKCSALSNLSVSCVCSYDFKLDVKYEVRY